MKLRHMVTRKPTLIVYCTKSSIFS